MSSDKPSALDPGRWWRLNMWLLVRIQKARTRGGRWAWSAALWLLRALVLNYQRERQALIVRAIRAVYTSAATVVFCFVGLAGTPSLPASWQRGVLLLGLVLAFRALDAQLAVVAPSIGTMLGEVNIGAAAEETPARTSAVFRNNDPPSDQGLATPNQPARPATPPTGRPSP